MYPIPPWICKAASATRFTISEQYTFTIAACCVTRCFWSRHQAVWWTICRPA